MKRLVLILVLIAAVGVYQADAAQGKKHKSQHNHHHRMVKQQNRSYVYSDFRHNAHTKVCHICHREAYPLRRCQTNNLHKKHILVCPRCLTRMNNKFIYNTR